MMQTAPHSNELFSFPMRLCRSAPNHRRYAASRPAVGTARCASSVVDAAGLGQFIYALGASGRRYVFSATDPERAELYENALFARHVPGTDRITVATHLALLSGVEGILYIHIPQDRRQCEKGAADLLAPGQ